MVFKLAPSAESSVYVEIRRRGLSHEKLTFVFDRYAGELQFDPPAAQPPRLTMTIDCAGVRNWSKSNRGKPRLTNCARKQLPPEMARLDALEFSPKPLLGWTAESLLSLAGRQHKWKLNLDFGPPKNGGILMEADAFFRLSELGIKPPASWLGLVSTDDQALFRASVWAVEIVP